MSLNWGGKLSTPHLESSSFRALKTASYMSYYTKYKKANMKDLKTCFRSVMKKYASGLQTFSANFTVMMNSCSNNVGHILKKENVIYVWYGLYFYALNVPSITPLVLQPRRLERSLSELNITKPLSAPATGDGICSTLFTTTSSFSLNRLILGSISSTDLGFLEILNF